MKKRVVSFREATKHAAKISPLLDELMAIECFRLNKGGITEAKANEKESCQLWGSDKELRDIKIHYSINSWQLSALD
jgi:hypothetical protein